MPSSVPAEAKYLKLAGGTDHALMHIVSVRDHTELIAWQLADQLRSLVWRMTETGPASRELKFRSQLRDSISVVCRNLAEGFYRFDHPEFAQFTRIARGSLGETQDLLLEGQWPTTSAQRISKRRRISQSARW